MFYLTETVYNGLEVDSDTLNEYFDNIEKEENLSIYELADFISDRYYLSDFNIGTDVEYNGDEDELYDLYTKYINEKQKLLPSSE